MQKRLLVQLSAALSHQKN